MFKLGLAGLARELFFCVAFGPALMFRVKVFGTPGLGIKRVQGGSAHWLTGSTYLQGTFRAYNRLDVDRLGNTEYGRLSAWQA